MASFLAFLKSKLLLPEDKEEVQTLEEDLSKRLLHYNAIKILTKKIFNLPRESKDFLGVNIKNEFKITNKICTKTSLQTYFLSILKLHKKKIL